MPRNCWTRCNKTFPCSFPAREKTREIESRETSKRLEKQAILALLRKMIYKFEFVDFILLQNYEQFNHRKRGINHVLHPRTNRLRQPSRPCFFSARTGRAAYPRRAGIPLETARQLDYPGKQMVQAQPKQRRRTH